jgi:hypothetical protein
MSGLDVSHLSASDALTAMRTYPGRFRATATAPEGEDADEVAARAGASGTSAVDALADVIGTWLVLARGLDQVARTCEPLLHPAVLDAGQRSFTPPQEMGLDGLLEMIEEAAADVIAAAGHVSSGDWDREGRVAGGGTVSALDLLHEAVRVGSEGLRSVRTTMGGH